MSSEPVEPVAPVEPVEPETSPAPVPETRWAWVKRQRRRIATVCMFALLLLLATHGSRVLPTTLELSLPIADAAHVTRIEATLYDEAGEVAHRVTRRFADGASERLELEASLLPGRYDVELRTARAAGETLLVGHVEVPADGRVTVHLSAP